MMQVFVRTHESQTLAVEVEASTSVAALKAQLADSTRFDYALSAETDIDP